MYLQYLNPNSWLVGDRVGACGQVGQFPVVSTESHILLEPLLIMENVSSDPFVHSISNCYNNHRVAY